MVKRIRRKHDIGRVGPGLLTVSLCTPPVRPENLRPLRRAIQKYIEDPVSELLIQSRDERVEAIEIRVGVDGLTVLARESEPLVTE